MKVWLKMMSKLFLKKGYSKYALLHWLLLPVLQGLLLFGIVVIYSIPAIWYFSQLNYKRLRHVNNPFVYVNKLMFGECGLPVFRSSSRRSETLA